jgi:hypothetical protein
MEIKILDLDDFDINTDMNNDADINNDIEYGDAYVFFSYPYYSHNDIDYQFRLTIIDNTIHIDEIKNDNTKDFDSVELLNNIKVLDSEKFEEYMSSFIDFRDDTTILVDGIINLNIELLDSNEKFNIIQKNKIYVLYEIYNNFLE